MEKPTIKFYSANDTYGEFSNFALYPIKLKGKTWQTREHYFQSQKIAGTAHEDKIRKSLNLMKAI
ncbi:MAG: putative NAD-dependent protein-ADP-ribosyltransferase YbiA (DUF1768 family) [Saprospiraceae bacterium]|jgi:predicted NAD-dependent protein-ADP-ribosyltransferase YbiA (DUF1768 family)